MKLLTSVNTVDLILLVVFVIIAIAAGTVFSIKEAKKFGVSKTHLIDGLIVGVPVVIIVARLITLLFAGTNLVNDGVYTAFGAQLTNFIDISDANTFLWAIIVCTIAFVVVFAAKVNLETSKVFDVVVPGMVVSIIVGRVALALVYPLFNSGASGVSLGLVNEILWTTLILGVLLMLRRFKSLIQSGDLLGVFLVLFGLGRVLLVEPYVGTIAKFEYLGTVIYSLFIVGGIAYLIVKRVKFPQDTYFSTINEIDVNKLHCYIFDLDQTLVKADKLVNAAYGEVISKNHTFTVYDNPQTVLDSDKLRKYSQFTKDHHELLTELYKGVNQTLRDINAQGAEVIITSKLPADLIAMKIQHYGLNRLVNRFIQSTDLEKLGKQYNPGSILVISSDSELLKTCASYSFKTAYAKFANPDLTGVISDQVLERISRTTYIV